MARSIQAPAPTFQCAAADIVIITVGPSFRQRVIRGQMPQITPADSAWKWSFTPWQRLCIDPGAEIGRVISATHPERRGHSGGAR